MVVKDVQGIFQLNPFFSLSFICFRSMQSEALSVGRSNQRGISTDMDLAIGSTIPRWGKARAVVIGLVVHLAGSLRTRHKTMVPPFLPRNGPIKGSGCIDS